MENKEIVIWHEMDGAGDSSLQFIELICQELEQKEKLKFKFVQMNISPFLAKLRNLENEPEKPDVIFIAQDMVSLEEASLSEVPDKFRDYMEDKIWDSMKYKGVQRGVPYLQGNHGVIFYNKKYFSSMPETWDEIIQLQKENVCNFSMDLKVVYWYLPFIYSTYGNPITNGEVTINAENTKEAQDFIVDLVNRGALQSYTAISTMLDKFIAGDIACMINGEWLYEYLNEQMGENVGIAPLPKMGNKEMSGVSSSVGMAFPNNSLTGPKQKELKTFIHYMLSKDVQERWLLEHKRIPVNKEIFDEMDKLDVDKNIITSCEQMKKNYFLINEECMKDMWQQGENIIRKIEQSIGN